MKKRNKLILIGICSILFLEGYLRFYWGFCDAVLMRSDDKFEYIAQPNQDRHRFRYHVRYNEFSMRSDKVSDSITNKVLFLGDSVINGGPLSDNDSLATTIIQKRYNEEFRDPIQTLNISAGSWGPDNCYAYLKKYGDFGAKIIFLVVSSHDAFDNMDFKPIIDKNPSYASKEYFSGIYELLDRYLIPRLKLLIFKSHTNDQDPISKGTVFNSGFNSLYNYSIKKNIPLIIYLHPEISEVRNKSYNSQGARIIEFCEANNIKLIKELDFHMEPFMYSDKIHLNSKGQKHMSEILIDKISKTIK